MELNSSAISWEQSASLRQNGSIVFQVHAQESSKTKQGTLQLTSGPAALNDDPLPWHQPINQWRPLLVVLGFFTRNGENTPQTCPDRFYQAYARAQRRQHRGKDGPLNRLRGWLCLVIFISWGQTRDLFEKGQFAEFSIPSLGDFPSRVAIIP